MLPYFNVTESNASPSINNETSLKSTTIYSRIKNSRERNSPVEEMDSHIYTKTVSRSINNTPFIVKDTATQRLYS